MVIRRVLISYKRTTYQLYVKQNPTARVQQLVKTRHPIARELSRAHDIHKQSIASIKSVLKKYKIAYKPQQRNFLQSPKDFDLVITIGGDGTFLRTSHFIDAHPPILGINSSPDHSIGALCSVTSDAFENRLLDLLEDRTQIDVWQRLELHLNGKRVKELILNDALVTNACPAAATRYTLHLGKYTEDHKSSGIWIATPTGSTAAIEAAGGSAMSPRSARKFQYVVREPYEPQQPRYRLIQGILRGEKKLVVTSQMGQGAIYIDGPRVHYPFNFGDEAVFSLSNKPLRVITFSK